MGRQKHSGMNASRHLMNLTLEIPVVTLCTMRFNIKKFYVLPTDFLSLGKICKIPQISVLIIM
jgi:hypothetical protein